MEIFSVPVSALEFDPFNARLHSPTSIAAIAASMREFGQRRPLVVRDAVVIAGNGTLKAAVSLGWTEILVTQVPEDWTDDQAKAYALADNRTAELAEWDEDILGKQLQDLDSTGFQIEAWGFDSLDFFADPFMHAKSMVDTETGVAERVSINLSEAWGVPPFSVLDQRAGQWQARKRAWISLGIESEVGRGENLLRFSDTIRQPDAQKRSRANTSDERTTSTPPILSDVSTSGTSVFDPVLTELMISWFSPNDGLVLDPFAGGSVRGIVAAALGRKYVGIELRDEQVSANRVQAIEILPKTGGKGSCEWITGDSNTMLQSLDIQADMILSCPPYADLEVYSEDPADLSNMTYERFLEIYRSIIRQSVARLKNDRFIAWVVGDVRGAKGIYKGLVPDTIEAFQDAGASYYNEGILVSPIGSVALRVNRQFQAGRKFGKAHQNVQIFVKGDGKKATQACGPIVLPDLSGAE